MRRIALAIAVVCALIPTACGRGGGASKINKASIDKAKALAAAVQPVADVRPKLVELLGEPTATDGENLIWAAVSGDECRHLTLMVQDGSAKGTTSGMAHTLVEGEFAKCKAWTGH